MHWIVVRFACSITVAALVGFAFYVQILKALTGLRTRPGQAQLDHAARLKYTIGTITRHDMNG